MTGSHNLRSILSDQPADEDQLNFTPYAKILAEIIADPGTDTPRPIGVFGGWGRGKTSKASREFIRGLIREICWKRLADASLCSNLFQQVCRTQLWNMAVRQSS
jgi:hypothetical protein